jgi:hypothetical protein
MVTDSRRKRWARSTGIYRQQKWQGELNDASRPISHSSGWLVWQLSDHNLTRPGAIFQPENGTEWNG